VIDVELTTLTSVHAEVPIRTVAPAAKPVPVIVTFCRPATSPDVGEIAETVGAGIYVNNPTPVLDRVSVFVTTMFAAPLGRAGEVQVIEVDETTTTEVQLAPPTDTVAPARNPVPVIVMFVLATAGPDTGDTETTVGAGCTTVMTPATYVIP
jgi:hypothetical protein